MTASPFEGLAVITLIAFLNQSDDFLVVETLQCNVSTEPTVDVHAEPTGDPYARSYSEHDANTHGENDTGTLEYLKIHTGPNDFEDLISCKDQFRSNISPKPGSLSTIIRSYKSAVAKDCHLINPFFNWQPRFHDHIIRDNDELTRIRRYINKNPANWREDTFFI